MRNIKTLLRLMGAATLTTVAASSVVACGDKQPPEFNGKYATLLGWYSDESTSKIKQELQLDNVTHKYSFIINEAPIINTDFKTKLLKNDAGKFKAHDSDAVALLADLGFKSGNDQKEYSQADIDNIAKLKAKVISHQTGNVEVNTATTDFKVAASTCQIDIMNDSSPKAKVLKSTTIKTLASDDLAISTKVVGVKNGPYGIVEKTKLVLDAASGFQVGKPTTSFNLQFNPTANQNKEEYDSLLKILNIKNVKLEFFKEEAATTPVTGNFEDEEMFLRLSFDNVVLASRIIDCGKPVPA